jgi:hypothetical protein
MPPAPELVARWEALAASAPEKAKGKPSDEEMAARRAHAAARKAFLAGLSAADRRHFEPPKVRKTSKHAQNLGQLHRFTAVFPHEYLGYLAHLGLFWVCLTSFSPKPQAQQQQKKAGPSEAEMLAALRAFAIPARPLVDIGANLQSKLSRPQIERQVRQAPGWPRSWANFSLL